MGVIWTDLGIPPSARENYGCTWKYLGGPSTCLRALQIIVKQSGKNNILFENAAGAPGNYSYYLSFNNF